MSEQSVPIQKIDPPLMLTSEGNKNPQMTTNPSQGMSNMPTSPPPPYPQQSFAAMPPTQAQPQQQYAQPQYQQQQQQPQQPQYQQQPQQPQYQQQQYQQTQQPQQPQYQQQQQQQYQQPAQMQTQTYPSQPSQVVSDTVHVRDVSYTEPAQPSVVYVENQPPPQQQTIIMQNTQLVSITSPLPTTATCPRCNNTITTVVNEVAGTTTYILSVVLCLVCWPLVWLPWVMSGCLDKVHSCPVCGNILATVKA